MRKLILPLWLLLVMPIANAETQKSIKGTRDAALEMISEFLQAQYKAPKEQIRQVSILNEAENSLTVQAKFQKNACTLTLLKKASANTFGWVVQQHRCDPEFSATTHPNELSAEKATKVVTEVTKHLGGYDGPFGVF
jgi:hypothetical protein